MNFFPLNRITELSRHMNIPRREGSWRWITSVARPLPNAIILGAQKSGTTSLFYYLAQHPDIAGSQPKEVHYFDLNYQRGPFWYRSHFPLRRSKVFLEASPEYLFLPYVPERIYQTTPHAKLIVLLRNPVERAISSYFHQVRAGRETLPIMEALEHETARTQEGITALIHQNYKPNLDYIHFSYKRKGHYLEQLRRYWDLFPKNQLLILKYEDFASHPIEIIKQVCRFLDIDPDFGEISLRRYNTGNNKREVVKEVYTSLYEYFRPQIDELSEALKMDLNWRSEY